MKVLLVLDKWLDSLGSEVKDGKQLALASIEKQGGMACVSSIIQHFGKYETRNHNIFSHLCQCCRVTDSSMSTRLVPVSSP